MLPIVAIAVVSAAGYALWGLGERKQAMRFAACSEGEEAARERRHEAAVSLLTQCLNAAGPLRAGPRACVQVARLEPRAPRTAELRGERPGGRLRAVPGTSYRDFLDFAVYLRDAGRAVDSLQAVLAAERVEGGRISMMTQYTKAGSCRSSAGTPRRSRRSLPA